MYPVTPPTGADAVHPPALATDICVDSRVGARVVNATAEAGAASWRLTT